MTFDPAAKAAGTTALPRACAAVTQEPGHRPVPLPCAGDGWPLPLFATLCHLEEERPRGRNYERPLCAGARCAHLVGQLPQWLVPLRGGLEEKQEVWRGRGAKPVPHPWQPWPPLWDPACRPAGTTTLWVSSGWLTPLPGCPHQFVTQLLGRLH